MRFFRFSAVCLLLAACAAEEEPGYEAVRQKLAHLPQGQHYLAVQGGWLVEHRCNLLPPADHEQLWVDKMVLREGLARQSMTLPDLRTLDAQAEKTSGADAYPCDAEKSRALVDAAVQIGAATRAKKP